MNEPGGYKPVRVPVAVFMIFLAILKPEFDLAEGRLGSRYFIDRTISYRYASIVI
jgi:hypothetical protein